MTCANISLPRTGRRIVEIGPHLQRASQGMAAGKRVLIHPG
jgi:hypothetical protein